MNKLAILATGIFAGMVINAICKRSLNINIVEKEKDKDIINPTVKVFISCPMHGKSNEEVEKVLKKCQEECITKINKEDPLAIVEFIDGFVPDQPYKNKPIGCLSHAIAKMADCDYAYFGEGWENARGCKIEHEIATQYGVKCLYHEN